MTDLDLNRFLHQCLLELDFVVSENTNSKRLGRIDFSDQFLKLIIRHKFIGNNLNVMRQSACLK